MAQPPDLLLLWQNCYPDKDRLLFEERCEHLFRRQVNGYCHILIAETRPHAIFEHSQHAPPPSQIIACGYLLWYRYKAEIADLVVQENFRNQGIGTALIQVLTGIAAEQGLDLIEIGVNQQNVNAIRLYRRLGFGNERLLKLSETEKAIFLSKSIIQKKK